MMAKTPSLTSRLTADCAPAAVDALSTEMSWSGWPW